MGLLPENKRKPPMDTPRTFFIWGATMSGKSYLAERFPDPFFINTDDNAEKAGLPNFQLKNEFNKDGSLKSSVIDQIDELLLELSTANKGFQTVVIDTIEDVIDLIEQAILSENHVKTLADMGYGKGYALQKQIVVGMVLELRALPLNIVFVSRLDDSKMDDNGNTVEAPALKTKWYNIVNGNSDLTIRTRRVGKNYSRSLTDKRKDYQRDQVKDQKILHILDNVPGVFPRTANSK
ncbi:AAA family ATPase [Lacticaseibacillus pantheris]|uniref:AAA family ATPase n=1 Tax=Lacticaseibacillus pantheris TaxID=171523 RepID=UPI00265A3F11|nr:AAA family ATPase [Lacticaseibacillus pantheris]WKF84463.1 AAA family ATPase [Lacticaseibacillus pantheris]